MQETKLFPPNLLARSAESPAELHAIHPVPQVFRKQQNYHSNAKLFAETHEFWLESSGIYSLIFLFQDLHLPAPAAPGPVSHVPASVSPAVL